VPSSYLCVTSLHVLHLDCLAANVLQKPLLGYSRDVNAVRYCGILVDQDPLVALFTQNRHWEVWQVEPRLGLARLGTRDQVCMYAA
jgi:hypothetical protein